MRENVHSSGNLNAFLVSLRSLAHSTHQYSRTRKFLGFWMSRIGCPQNERSNISLCSLVIGLQVSNYRFPPKANRSFRFGLSISRLDRIQNSWTVVIVKNHKDAPDSNFVSKQIAQIDTDDGPRRGIWNWVILGL